MNRSHALTLMRAAISKGNGWAVSVASGSYMMTRAFPDFVWWL